MTFRVTSGHGFLQGNHLELSVNSSCLLCWSQAPSCAPLCPRLQVPVSIHKSAGSQARPLRFTPGCVALSTWFLLSDLSFLSCKMSLIIVSNSLDGGIKGVETCKTPRAVRGTRWKLNNVCCYCGYYEFLTSCYLSHFSHLYYLCGPYWCLCFWLQLQGKPHPPGEVGKTAGFLCAGGQEGLHPVY